jgi:hypothetical protein
MACDDAGTASIAVQAATAARNLAMIASLLDVDSVHDCSRRTNERCTDQNVVASV